MNKQTVYLLIGVAAIGAIGYYLYQRNQRERITTPTAPVVANPSNGGVVGSIQDAWDAIFGRS